MQLQETLSLQVFVHFASDHVSDRILVFLVNVWVPLRHLFFRFQFVPQIKRVLDFCDVGEVRSVRDSEASHSMRVAPFLKKRNCLEIKFRTYVEMLLESLRTLVCLISANLARVREVETMKLVEPIRDWFSVPAEWKILRIVRSTFVNFLFLFNLRKKNLEF